MKSKDRPKNNFFMIFLVMVLVGYSFYHRFLEQQSISTSGHIGVETSVTASFLLLQTSNYK